MSDVAIIIYVSSCCFFLLSTCVLKGNTATCDLGRRSEAGECTLCEANTYADGTRLDGANDGGIRVQCKPCPLGTITNQSGSSSLNQCLGGEVETVDARSNAAGLASGILAVSAVVVVFF